MTPLPRGMTEPDAEMAARDDQMDAGFGTGYIGEFANQPIRVVDLADHEHAVALGETCACGVVLDCGCPFRGHGFRHE